MHKYIIRILACLTGIGILMSAMLVLTPEVHAALRPYNHIGTVTEVDQKENTITIETEYEWHQDGWIPYSDILEGTASKNAMNEINVGDYVESATLATPGGESIIAWVALARMSRAERTISDMYGSVGSLETALLGGYKIGYHHKPDCSSCGVMHCKAKYTTIIITAESGQEHSHQLYLGQSYVYEGERHRITIVFHSGQTYAYPECTDQPMPGPQPISDFTIHIETISFDHEEPPSHTAILYGAIGGGAALLGLTVLLIFRRRRRAAK